MERCSQKKLVITCFTVLLTVMVTRVFSLKVSYACGTISDKKITVYMTDDMREGYKILETDGYNRSIERRDHPCIAGGVATHESTLTLVITQPLFDTCGVVEKRNGEVAVVNMSAYMGNLSTNIVTKGSYRNFIVTCDFKLPPRQQSVSFADIRTVRECIAGMFFCVYKNKCMNSMVRCAGATTGVERCVDKNSREIGCNANPNGTYNIEKCEKDGKVEWLEYRGFAYLRKDFLASEDDVTNPLHKNKYDLCRKSYKRVGVSTCTYRETGQYNTWFNSLPRASILVCMDFFKGLETLLVDSCVEYTKKKLTGGDSLDRYLFDISSINKTATGDCSYTRVTGKGTAGVVTADRAMTMAIAAALLVFYMYNT